MPTCIDVDSEGTRLNNRPYSQQMYETVEKSRKSHCPAVTDALAKSFWSLRDL